MSVSKPYLYGFKIANLIRFSMHLERNIRLMYFINFLRHLEFWGALSIPFLLEWGQLNFTKAFLLQAWFVFWIFLLEIPTGVVADKFGRKASILLSGIFTSLSFFTYTIRPDFYLFLFAEFLGALGFALISGAEGAMIYDTLKQIKKTSESKRAFANYHISGTLGIILAFPTGSMLVGNLGIPYPNNLAFVVFLTGFIIMASAAVSLLLQEPKRTRPAETYIQMGIKGFHYLSRHKRLRPLAFNYALISAITFFMYWLYQPIAGSAGIDIKYYGFIGASYNILAILLLSKVKLWEKIIGPRNLLYITAFIPGIFYIILGFTKIIWIMLPSVLLIASFRGLREPLFSHYMNYYIKSSNRATVLSSINMLQKLVTMILYPLIGFLLDISLDYTLVLLGLFTLIFAFMSKVEEESLKV